MSNMTLCPEPVWNCSKVFVLLSATECITGICWSMFWGENWVWVENYFWYFHQISFFLPAFQKWYMLVFMEPSACYKKHVQVTWVMIHNFLTMLNTACVDEVNPGKRYTCWWLLEHVFEEKLSCWRNISKLSDSWDANCSKRGGANSLSEYYKCLVSSRGITFILFTIGRSVSWDRIAGVMCAVTKAKLVIDVQLISPIWLAACQTSTT